MSGPAMNAGLRARLRSVSTWVFDLDNTLYPADSTLYDTIGARMTSYIARAAAVDDAEALRLRELYFHQYGATVVGLQRHHGVDASDFLAHVHDVDRGVVAPDAALNTLIARLPGRRIVFTNGGGGHAEALLEQLGLATLFEPPFDIEGAALMPKPQPGAYDRLIERFGFDPAGAVLVEDTLRNLEPAHALGFVTVLVGPVHPAPLPDYVDHHAHDVTAFLRDALAA